MGLFHYKIKTINEDNLIQEVWYSIDERFKDSYTNYYKLDYTEFDKVVRVYLHAEEGPARITTINGISKKEYYVEGVKK